MSITSTSVWRTFLGSNGVRNFITALAEQTLTLAGGDDVDAWPYCDICTSLQVIEDDDALSDLFAIVQPQVNFIDDDNLREDPTRYYDDKRAQIQPLVEQAMGATIAYLLYASETKLPQCIDDGRYGCVDNADCCDSGYVCTSNVCEPP